VEHGHLDEDELVVPEVHGIFGLDDVEVPVLVEVPPDHLCPVARAVDGNAGHLPHEAE